MIRIAMVEDDDEYINILTEHLNHYEKELGEKINLTVFRDGEDITEDYKADFDIILMDVEMRFMDGMTAAEEIRKTDSEVIIIFITNMPQYAINGYKVDALDYVLKPVSYFAFSQRIDRALTRLKRRNKKYITLTLKGSMGGVKKLDISKLCYIEVLNHDLIFYTTDGEFVSAGSMNEAEEMLDRLECRNFFRCSRCYLVNLEYVDNFQNNNAFIGNNIVTVSRARKKAFLDALNNYINEVGK